MFGSIGTFNAAGSKFSHTTGDQYNTNVPPPPGMAGPMDPQFQQFWGRSINDVPSPRRHAAKPMFGEIDHFLADGSTFNDTTGNQYNYSITSPSVAPFSQPQRVSQSPFAAFPAAKSYSPPNTHSTPEPEIIPSSAEARMFGRINNFRAERSEYNNSTGNQVNIQASPNIAAYRPTPSYRPPHAHKASLTQIRNASSPEDRVLTSSPDSSGAIDTALGVSAFVLTTLENAAQFSPISYLAQAAGMSLAILHGVQGSRDNKDGFIRLATHACDLISSVVVVQERRHKEGRELPPELIANLQELVRKLEPIHAFMVKKSTRNGFTRVMMHKADAAKIMEYRQKLTEALAEFGLRSNINVEDGVAQIDKRLEDLVEALQIDKSSRPAPSYRSYDDGVVDDEGNFR